MLDVKVNEHAQMFTTQSKGSTLAAKAGSHYKLPVMLKIEHTDSFIFASRTIILV